jgi:transposase-like protein
MTPKQRTGLLALLSTPSVAAAARASGLSRETLHRWLRDPDFRAELDWHRDEAFRIGLCRVVSAAERAVETLTELLRYGSPRVQLKAAKATLGLVLGANRALRDGGMG